MRHMEIAEDLMPDAELHADTVSGSPGSEDLQTQLRLLKHVLSSIGDGVVVADANGKFRVFNPAAEKLLGLGPADAGPEKWPETYNIFFPDKVTPVPSELLPLVRALRGEETDSVDLYIRHRNGEQGNWISCTARPLKSKDGTVEGGVVVCRDVNSRKRLEEQLEAARQQAEASNHAKSDFLSRMSHELRTPLNSILGFAQVLRMGDLGERPRECVDHILKAGKHLLGLIDEVLEISRIEAGRLALSPEPVQVADVVHQVLDMIRPIAESSGIQISEGGKIDEHCYVTADRQRLQQVLLNLLSNAVKYNRESGRADIDCQVLESGRVRIDVADTGPGISAEHQARLFTPFERLDADRTQIQGTGLGLALSKKLVESMGGLLSLNSAMGRGSTFSVELPSAEAPVARVQRETPSSLIAAAHNEARRGTVLYVEDNVSNVRLMEHVFGYLPGVRLLVAMQGRMALDLAIEHMPDLVFLDLHLPDVSGDQILVQLRNHPSTRHIPVVMVSADATAGQIRRLREAGANDYVTKPVDVEKLFAILSANLKGGGLRQELALAGTERQQR
jgi:PAS domain S-box-containing protein